MSNLNFNAPLTISPLIIDAYKRLVGGLTHEERVCLCKSPFELNNPDFALLVGFVVGAVITPEKRVYKRLFNNKQLIIMYAEHEINKYKAASILLGEAVNRDDKTKHN